MLSDVKCKRIIDGKTYNTETATQLVGWHDQNGDTPFESGTALYQTRFGAFFLYSFFEGFGEDDWEKIEPMSPEQAQAWLEKNASWRTDLIEDLFGEMPEAGSAEVKYTLRMPEILRDRLALLAKANGQSLNAWMIRCLEAGSTSPGEVRPHASGKEASDEA
jgi:hypothetical protein